MNISFGSQLFQYLITGIMIGSVYGLVALGFNIIYKSTEIINLAQGDFVMLGGLGSVFFVSVLHFPLLLSVIFGLIFAMCAGAIFERIAIWPLKNASLVTLILITLAGSLILEGSVMIVMGKNPYSLPPFSSTHSIHLFGAVISIQYLWVIGISIVTIIVMNYFFNRTSAGKAMTACADNPVAALLMGIPVKRMVLLSFAISALIGALAGAAITPSMLMEYDRGPMLTIKGFAAAIIGGLGSFGGSIVGGLILGITEAMFAGLISSGYKDVASLAILLIILFVKPTGIFGNKDASKLKK